MRFYLKKRILVFYDTQSAFARDCGRNDNWISRIITGRQDPTEEEKKMITEKLQAEGRENLFFMKIEDRSERLNISIRNGKLTQ